MRILNRREKPLRMVWRVEKNNICSLLVGTAHFFPHSYEKALTRLIDGAENVMLEGPLDNASMERVVECGCDK